MKHFVTFMSPGTFFSETTTKEIPNWDVDMAVSMSKEIVERYNATPYCFFFTTKENDKQIARSGNYFLGGKVLTLEDVLARKDPKDRILIDNMKCNGYNVIENTNSFRITVPFEKGDILLNC